MSESQTDHEGAEDIVDPPLDEPNAEASSSSGSPDAKEPTLDEYQMAREALGETSSDSGDSQEAEAASEPAKQEDAGEDDELPDEVTDDELQAYKPKTRRRIEKLLEDGKADKAEIERLKGPAQEYEQIETFLRNSGVTYEEAGDALQLAALMKSDPVKAYNDLLPVLQDLGKRVGAYLPADLQDQVSKGLMSREAAQETARLRARDTLSQEQLQRQRETSARDAQQQTVNAMRRAVGDWERQLASSDPDFEKKRARLKDRIELELGRAQRSGTSPKSEADAVALAQKAYEAVNADLAPVKKPTVTPLDGGASRGAVAPPKDEYEAARRALKSA